MTDSSKLQGALAIFWFHFIQQAVSLLRDVEKVPTEIEGKGEKVDLLFMVASERYKESRSNGSARMECARNLGQGDSSFLTIPAPTTPPPRDLLQILHSLYPV